MIMKHDYLPSPPSNEDTASETATHKRKISISIMDDYVQAPLLDSLSTIQRARRNRAPPRNANGQYYCRHPHCQGKDQTFKRVCEWNKHMDRHERPYKCQEVGCELNPGFTYSGGLLRHQREVHKMHLSTKQPLYCPFPNCNRSSGIGFTRRENLEEHKRRRHVDEQISEEPEQDEAATQPSQPPPSRATEPISEESPAKRMRMLTPAPPPEVKFQVRAIAEVAQTLRERGMNEQQLLEEQQSRILEKDDMIKRQAAEIRRLQNFISALPPSAVFMSTSTSRAQMAQLPAGGGGGSSG
ncbi:putative C2H2 transcription factor [Exophiala viscosa]|uniref:C2H2 transcription factor n=1 Tax=Exophiala viscosa TaxID=2486360 RepID=A0AAN6ID48_9EURO|nr:putative C2H2 transcription factor [Exophiala viscosa]KAI1625728.1 putative C2H2 transcription factor [Exophiala viscosa]